MRFLPFNLSRGFIHLRQWRSRWSFCLNLHRCKWGSVDSSMHGLDFLTAPVTKGKNRS
ncbi:hypothetical protein ZOSMA_29G00340 [Zostera marina]|uniref:Uncharacterized protein n=1 Tax=Zostera marina TaxID=29655 RepID=A0A0K9PDS6_ZOSMR|nr:hypothetical protein ZOSMA_29G00340 [Zostera marina]